MTRPTQRARRTLRYRVVELSIEAAATREEGFAAW